jgi:ArsR family metal-binding transcriptional regulator
MYLEAISLSRTTPCLAEPGKIIVTGRPSRRLDEVLPYLAALPGVIAYNPVPWDSHFSTPARFPDRLS